MKKHIIPILKFFSLQSMISVLGLLSGFIIINYFSKKDYALLTMITVYSSSLIMLTDSGISSGLNALIGKFWQDKVVLNKMVSSAFALRKRTFLLVAPVISLLLIANLLKLEYTYFVVAIVLGFVLAEFYIRINFSFNKVVLQLFDQVTHLQFAEILFNCIRFAGIGLVILIAHLLQIPFYVSLLLYVFVLLAYVYQNKYIRNKVHAITGDHVAPEKTYIEELKKYFNRQIPNTIFYSVHSQVMIWIVSFIGSASSIADIGALGRISILFALILNFFQSVVLPKYSKNQNVAQLKKYYIYILGAYILFASMFFFLSLYFKDTFILILGDKYASSKDILPFMVLNTLANSFAGFLYAINVSKGWMRYSWMIIVLELISWLILPMILDLTQMKEVILFSTISVLIGTSANFIMTWSGIKHYHLQFNNIK